MSDSPSSIILPDSVRPAEAELPPSPELKAKCDHQDMVYEFDKESGKYICLCGALVEVASGEVKCSNHGLNADGMFATKVVMKELVPPPPIIEQRFYERGRFSITETVIVGGAGGEGGFQPPRFMTVLEVRDGGASVESKPIVLDAESVEQAFDLIPAIYMTLRPGALKVIMNARLTRGLKPIPTPGRPAGLGRPHIQQRNGRSR